MSYLDRLKAQSGEKGLPHEPTKPPKPGFVGFVGAQDGPISAETRIRDGMARLWDRHGWREHRDFPEALRIALAMPDAALALLAAEGCL